MLIDPGRGLQRERFHDQRPDDHDPGECLRQLRPRLLPQLAQPASLAPNRSATFTTTIPASQYNSRLAAPHYGVTFEATGQLLTGRTGTAWTAVDLRVEP